MDKVRNKLKQVRRIESGLEVDGTDLETFDLLPQVEQILNPDGPAIIFKNNGKLQRILMPKLLALNGKDVRIFIDIL